MPPRCIPIHANVTTYDWEPLIAASRFDVVMMDPPWQLATANPTRGVALGYSQLTDADIARVPVPRLQDAGFLFLWVINAKFQFCLDLLDQWGYTCAVAGAPLFLFCCPSLFFFYFMEKGLPPLLPPAPQSRSCSCVPLLSRHPSVPPQARGRDSVGENDGESSTGKEPRILPAARQGGVPGSPQGPRSAPGHAERARMARRHPQVWGRLGRGGHGRHACRGSGNGWRWSVGWAVDTSGQVLPGLGDLVRCGDLPGTGWSRCPPPGHGPLPTPKTCSERRGQSQKPEEMYQLIERLVPNGTFHRERGRCCCARGACGARDLRSSRSTAPLSARRRPCPACTQCTASQPRPPARSHRCHGPCLPPPPPLANAAAGRYLEIFGRKNNLRDYWVTIGNEITGKGLPASDASALRHGVMVPGAVYGRSNS